MKVGNPGYSKDRFIVNVDNNLLCPICNGVFREPVILPCDHSFCEFCLDSCSKEKCPRCQAPFSEKKKWNQPLLSFLQKLFIKCSFTDQGCPGIVKLPDLNEHETNCLYRTVKCPECGLPVMMKDRFKHRVKHATNGLEDKADELKQKLEEAEAKVRVLTKENNVLKDKLKISGVNNASEDSN